MGNEAGATGKTNDRAVMVVVVVIALGAVLLLMRPWADSSDKKPAPAAKVTAKPAKANPATDPPTAEATVAKLIRDYNANEVAADASYKNKVIRVIGIVDTVKKAGDLPIVMFHAGGDYRLQADFASDSGLSALKPSDFIAIRCRGAGLYGGFPLIVDCVFEKTLTAAEVDALK